MVLQKKKGIEAKEELEKGINERTKNKRDIKKKFRKNI